MKNKKNRLVLAVVCMVACLGVVFAAVSGVGLSISGNVATDTHDLNVYFNGTVSNSTTGCDNCTAAVATPAATNGTLEATIDVSGLEKVGDYVTATYTIKNAEKDLAATIALDTEKGTSGISNNNTEYFTVTSDSITGSPIAAGGTGTVTIKVELKKVPIDSNDSTGAVTVYYKATPAQGS